MSETEKTGSRGAQDIQELLCLSSDRQLDASMLPLIRKWDDPATAIQVLEVLDYCINGALASGFIITLLQVMYDVALKREGMTHEEIITKAAWRQRL